MSVWHIDFCGVVLRVKPGWQVVLFLVTAAVYGWVLADIVWALLVD